MQVRSFDLDLIRIFTNYNLSLQCWQPESRHDQQANATEPAK
jgi:hypothetical protein